MKRIFLLCCLFLLFYGSANAELTTIGTAQFNGTIPLFAFSASWELYDDFSSGALDAQKWDNRSTVSTVTVENQKLKIIHLRGHPDKSGYLNLIQNPENILGIKAAITISSCTGDVRIRIVGYAGKIGEYHIFSQVTLQPGFERIYSYGALEGPPPDYTSPNDLYRVNFQTPLNLTGNTYTASIIFSNDSITNEIDGLGKIIYKYATDIEAATNFFKAIGTKSTNGDGPCTVYIDDVYVLRP